MSRRISIFGASFASISYLLDDATIASGIAAPFALFRLKTGYTGPVVDVRRTVGATTTIVSVGLGSGTQFTLDAPVTGVVTGSSAAANLGEFVNASGYANADSLPAAQDWFYSKGYNQNNGAQVWVQATATQQPRGGTAGVMRTRNGRAEMGFDGSNDSVNFGLLGGATKPANWSNIIVGAFDGALNTYQTLSASSNTPSTASALTWGSIINRDSRPALLESVYGDGPPTDVSRAYGEYTTAAAIVRFQQQIFEQHKANGVQGVEVYVDGIGPRAMTPWFGSAVNTAGTNYEFHVGSYGEFSGLFHLNGGVQFVGVWTTNKEADRLAIKQKINEMLGTTW